MTDEQLLENAANAAGILSWREDAWDPLFDDGDALRLVAKMKLRITVTDNCIYVGSKSSRVLGVGYSKAEDAAAVLRSAIVRAVACGKGRSREAA
jgi:hypothetical protein